MDNPIYDKQVGQIVSIVQDNHQPSGVRISVNPGYASTIAEKIKPYQNFPRTMRPALENVADYVRTTMIPRTFQQEGPGWRHLARRTQIERKAAGYDPMHPILVRTGDLKAELIERGHPNHIEVIKTGKYARIILGGSSDKFVRNQGGNQMFHIPPRPMIPGTGNLELPNKDKEQIVNILRNSIKRSVKK